MSDIDKVKKLRVATGAGFKDCNLAIKESDGDLDKAVEILRIKGVSKASKKMSRDAKEGVVAISGDQKKTSIIEVNCETDFVAKNEDFISFVKEISELNNTNNSNLEDLEKSKMRNGDTVKNNLVALIAKIGEKITIGQTKTITNSGSLYKIDDNVKVTAGGVGALFQIADIGAGKIGELVLDDAGSNYAIGDTINFDNTGTFGSNAAGFVRVVNGGIANEDSSGDNVVLEEETESGDIYSGNKIVQEAATGCLLYTSPSPRDKRQSRMPSSA